MALSIKHPEADRLARRLASATGLSLTDAILKALREQLERETGRRQGSGLADDLRAISDRCAALPDLDTRTPEAILGFDEHGLPR
ncbi:MAG: type II toxin-antitoxin system VapB family antitoxin [Bryobacterales bacterium]|nr:type II toxin-antitoxin system VapB family antitoxin [Bryobacterales bacterium]